MTVRSLITLTLRRTVGKSGKSRCRKPALEFMEERVLLSVTPATPNLGANNSIAIVLLSKSNRTETGVSMPLTKHQPSDSTTVRAAHSSYGHRANLEKHA